MPKMKFQVVNPEHSTQIQRALFRLGAGWNGTEMTVQHTDKPYLYTEEEHDGIYILYSGSLYEDAGVDVVSGSDFFEKDSSAEYVYRLGMVEPRNGRPLLVEPLLDSEDPTDMHAHLPDPKVYSARKEQPPLGPKPSKLGNGDGNLCLRIKSCWKARQGRSARRSASTWCRVRCGTWQNGLSLRHPD